MAADLSQPLLRLLPGDNPEEILSTPKDFVWPQAGTLELVFEFPNIGTSLELASDDRNGYVGSPLFDLPFLKAHFWIHIKEGAHTGAGINLKIPTVDGKEKSLQLKLSRLDGKKRYQLVSTWDLSKTEVTLYLQGIKQGDLSHWGDFGPGMAPAGQGEGKIGGGLKDGGESISSLRIHRAQLFDIPFSEEQVAALAAPLDLPPLSGEGRTVYTQPIDTEGLTFEPVFETDFKEPLNWVHEETLLEDDKRVRKPDAEWILEGPLASLTPVEKGIRLATSDPEDKKLGHMVLWLNKEMPADFLLEYSFSPKDDRKGLGIVFFNARNPNGETIFDLSLPPRRGMFREYIIGAIDSYHVSPWAADDKNLRRTANMRKNSGFYLVSVGNDLIGGSGPGPHTVRILKQGGHIQVEANGIIALDYTDTGKANGPIHDQPGLIGIRFMAHSESAVIHQIKISKRANDPE
jgi:hypothetical protein